MWAGIAKNVIQYMIIEIANYPLNFDSKKLYGVLI